ncbi:MAG: response regulator [Cohnella sp.]|nr:response regulator [Cohnella sp.]
MTGMDGMIALVVDDEPESRDGLRRIIPWQELGIELVLEAGNGKLALELIEEYKPALILTDLIMPALNGIELMRELARMRISAKVIVVTGHNEFQYARDSLRLGAFDYILKPFRIHEVLPIVKQCIEDIRLSQFANRKQRQEQEKYAQALSLLQDKVIRDLLAGHIHGDKIRTALEQVSLGWMLHVPLTVLSLEIDNFMSEYKDRDLMVFAIGNVAKDSIANQLPFHLVYNDSGRWMLFLGSGAKEKVQRMASTLIDHIGRYVKLDVTIGAGPACRLETLPHAYAVSMEALEYKTIFGGNRVLFSDEVNLHPLNDRLQSSPIEQELLSALKTGAILNKDAFRPKVIRLLHSWGEHKRETVQRRLYEWLLKVERQLKANNPALDVLGNEPLQQWKLFSRYDTRDSIVECALSILECMTIQNHAAQNNQLGQVTTKALQLIEERYASHDITLSSLAEMVYVSPVWLSHLLKGKTGKTFLELLTERRISQAKRLLRDLSLKAYEVSERVGYKDTEYFAKQFKKHTNMTPTEYRNQNFSP